MSLQSNSNQDNSDQWKLTSVCPCHGETRDHFVQWMYDLQIDSEENWMFIGDFNFYRSLENKNRVGGNINDINIFSAIFSNHGLMEIPLKGRKYTWSNMQEQPLMEQLDWCFTTLAWTIECPNTLLIPMAKPTSDHIPCTTQIGTTIPKAQIFRFENF